MAKKKTHVMVAYSGEMTDVFRDVLRDSLTPDAVAAAAALLAGPTLDERGVPLKRRRPEVTAELEWLQAELISMLGGKQKYTALRQELGL